MPLIWVVAVGKDNAERCNAHDSACADAAAADEKVVAVVVLDPMAVDADDERETSEGSSAV